MLVSELIYRGLLVALLALAPLLAHAQSWKPEKPVDLIVGNKPGGGGAVGLAFMANHKDDAHYLQIVVQSLLSNPIAGRSKLTYTDFSPVAIFAVEYADVKALLVEMGLAK